MANNRLAPRAQNEVSNRLFDAHSSPNSVRHIRTESPREFTRCFNPRKETLSCPLGCVPRFRLPLSLMLAPSCRRQIG